MDKKAFYDGVRGIFLKDTLTREQIEGIEAIFEGFERWGVTDLRHQAYMLATVHWETGERMQPIKETMRAGERMISDARVKARLDRAWEKGQLSWVSAPYWHDGAFGRGLVQLTHWNNYSKMGRRLGIPLRENPEMALHMSTSVDILIVGMMEGKFTGVALPDWISGDKCDFRQARRVVNGLDRAGHIATVAKEFLTALDEAQVSEERKDKAKKGVATGIVLSFAGLLSWFGDNPWLVTIAVATLFAGLVAMWLWRR